MASLHRVALVTGGSRGIGRAICVRLALNGMKVAVNYQHNSAAANETVQMIRNAGGEAIVVQGSVQSEIDAERIVNDSCEQFGPISVLVNNAGIVKDKLLFMMKESDWKEVIEVNLFGSMFVSRVALRYMLKERFGRILNISSISGLVGTPGQTNYAASKAGLIGFTRSLAGEVAQFGITVNAIAAGYVDTEMVKTIKPELLEKLVAGIPVRRIATCEEIAGVAAFLCGPEAGYITGQVLPVDGGISIS